MKEWLRQNWALYQTLALEQCLWKGVRGTKWVWELKFDICLDLPSWSALRERVWNFLLVFFIESSTAPPPIIYPKPNTLVLSVSIMSKTWWAGQQCVDSPQTSLVASFQTICFDAVYHRQSKHCALNSGPEIQQFYELVKTSHCAMLEMWHWQRWGLVLPPKQDQEF